MKSSKQSTFSKRNVILSWLVTRWYCFIVYNVLFSLVGTGYDVRISGQDVGRGTFSQRHCMLVDQNSNEMYIPLNDLECSEGQGHLEV